MFSMIDKSCLNIKQNMYQFENKCEWDGFSKMSTAIAYVVLKLMQDYAYYYKFFGKAASI